MPIYRIADLNIAIKPRYDYTKRYLSDYETDAADAAFSVEVSDDLLKKEEALTEQPVRKELYEITAILRVICDEIIKRDGFFLHCSCLKYQDTAVVFTAPSGTGKSTHARLWRETLGDRVTMINDDKPLVRKKDGRFFIFGTPWNGKHGISNDISAPISTIFFLAQAKENRTEPLSRADALTLLLQQTVLPEKKEAMSALLDMLTELLQDVKCFRLYCNISADAVKTALSVIDKSSI